MAIAGAMKVAGKALGKAIKVIKKKKKQLETKGRRTKNQAVENLAKKEKKSVKTKVRMKKDVTPEMMEKGVGVESIEKSLIGGSLKSKILNKTPNVIAGAAGATAQVGKKAVKATKSKVRNFKKSPAGIATTASLKSIDETTGGFVSGRNIAAVAGVAGALGLTQSIIKSNSSPEQEYTQERRSDGRFATTYKGKNANVVASAKQLSTKEIDDVRTRLAVLDSILESNDPKSRSKEFKETVAYLATKYQISNISGKQLSIIIPNIKGGVQTFKKRTGISKLLLGDPSTNKNIQAAQRYYDENIKG